ncbi:Itaconate transport protein like [Verticillium longisporum]|nr:Itaconate transport protein like [Verticillium longisporum]
MYSLLTPIRYILNPRLGLTTPLQSGLIYLAPGAGYLVGTTLGGRWSDHNVKSWMHRRGFRLWEDRLRSTLFFMLGLLPGFTLLYGWAVQEGWGGIALPVVCLFGQGVCQTTTFPSLNAYILDIMQDQSGKASASHYMVRYCFSALATATVVPMIDAIGVGWTVSISSAMVFFSGCLILRVIHFGGSWRGAGAGAGRGMGMGMGTGRVGGQPV